MISHYLETYRPLYLCCPKCCVASGIEDKEKVGEPRIRQVGEGRLCIPFSEMIP